MFAHTERCEIKVEIWSTVNYHWSNTVPHLHTWQIESGIHIYTSRSPTSPQYQDPLGVMVIQRIYWHGAYISITFSRIYKDLHISMVLNNKFGFKGTSVIVHSKFHFFTKPLHFLHIQRERHCNNQTMEDTTAHDRRTTFLAIRLYHVIYPVLRAGSRWHD